MNLIYVYSLKFNLLGSFYASNGYGIDQVGAAEFIKPDALPDEVKTNFIMKQTKVIVKRMD
jgi:hypothetical protein